MMCVSKNSARKSRNKFATDSPDNTGDGALASAFLEKAIEARRIRFCFLAKDHEQNKVPI